MPLMAAIQRHMLDGGNQYQAGVVDFSRTANALVAHAQGWTM